MNTLKTLEEHRQYLYEIVRLKLWYIHYLLHHDQTVLFQEALENRVDIIRKTSFNKQLLNPEDISQCFNDPGWKAMVIKLEKIYDRYADNAMLFEEEAFGVLRPFIDERAVCDWIDVSRINGYQCGSLRYNTSPGKDKYKSVYFHIANAVQPQSMFADPLYLCSCFSELMRQTEYRWGSSALGVGSWLNSYPKWLHYFPREYHERMSEENRVISWHYGFWGQFITSRGTFNSRLGNQFRTTGELPYYPRSSYCTFEEMRRHLTVTFGVKFHADGWMI